MEESKTEICMLRRRIAELEKERQADKEKIKELESDKEIKDKMIEKYETIFKRQEELEQERKMLIKQGWIDEG